MNVGEDKDYPIVSHRRSSSDNDLYITQGASNVPMFANICRLKNLIVGGPRLFFYQRDMDVMRVVFTMAMCG